MPCLPRPPALTAALKEGFEVPFDQTLKYVWQWFSNDPALGCSPISPVTTFDYTFVFGTGVAIYWDPAEIDPRVDYIRIYVKYQNWSTFQYNALDVASYEDLNAGIDGIIGAFGGSDPENYPPSGFNEADYLGSEPERSPCQPPTDGGGGSKHCREARNGTGPVLPPVDGQWAAACAGAGTVALADDIIDSETWS